MTATEKVLSALQAHGSKTHREKPGQWAAQCPCHDDRKASLAVAEGRDGRTLVRCLAGCSTPSVIEALGLKMSDLFNDNGNGGRGRIVKSYVYHDEQGNELFSVSRFEPKDFRQSREEKWGRVWSLDTWDGLSAFIAYAPREKRRLPRSLAPRDEPPIGD
ncbi:MAG TPA: hypothetical protein VM425_06350 [Myxococcota bacterium]|nr:hypothetical protein [Myxococcota bacterium]